MKTNKLVEIVLKSICFSCIIPDFRGCEIKNGAKPCLTGMHHFYLLICKIVICNGMIKC